MLPYGPMRSRAGEAVLVVAAAVLLTAVMTWPLALRGASAGRIDSGDGQFSIWNVAWVARTLVVDPRNLYDANIFYPHRGTLAYSEANLGAGVLAVPFYWASGGNPYVAHNAVVFLASCGTSRVIGAAPPWPPPPSRSVRTCSHTFRTSSCS